MNRRAGTVLVARQDSSFRPRTLAGTQDRWAMEDLVGDLDEIPSQL